MIRLAVLVIITYSSIFLPYAKASDSPTELDQPVEPEMSLSRMSEILLALDPRATTNDSSFMITIEGVQLFIITDTSNDRMRVMTPIRPREEITSSEMTRMMQANFDSALDARYAIAQDMLWSVYIHPMSPLKKNQLISGIGQVVNLVRSYGTVYSGGALSFGGGDSEGINRQLIERLLERGEEV